MKKFERNVAQHEGYFADSYERLAEVLFSFFLCL